MASHLESKLYADVEGTCSGQFGYIISVIGILDIGRGTVVSGSGMSGQAEFVTRYRAIVFKPFKGEVVDGVVNNVTKVPSRYYYRIDADFRIIRWASLRMLDLCKFSWPIKLVFIYDEWTFVYSALAFIQLIHVDMKFDPNANPPCFASEDQVNHCLHVHFEVN